MEYNIPFQMKDVLPNLYDHWIAKDMLTYMAVSYTHLAGQMIRGFDAAVADMEVGQVVDVHLMPEEAYGMAAVSYTHLDVYKRQGIWKRYEPDHCLHVG